MESQFLSDSVCEESLREVCQMYFSFEKILFFKIGFYDFLQY
jgi:hypothetical protein